MIAPLPNLPDFLARVVEYMDDRADADGDGGRFVPNEAMSLGRDAQALLDELAK